MFSRPLRRLLSLSVLFVILQSPKVVYAASEGALARSILERADQIRFPGEGFQVDVSITSTSPTQAIDIRKYRIYSKGNEKTVVMVVAPTEERGTKLLMEGRDLWFS